MYQETDMEREQERRKSVNELSDLIVSNIAYRNCLESLVKSNNLNVFCNVEKLKVIYASFLMLLWKDEFSKNAESGKLHPFLLDSLIKYVSEEKDNNYHIGDIQFEDQYSVIDFIRNKMAHGDYLIEEDEVYFKKDGKSGSIEIDNLVDFTTMLVTKMNKMKLTGKNKKVFINVAMPKKYKYKNMKTLEDIKERLFELRYIEVNDEPYKNKERTLNYIKIVDDFTNNFRKGNKELTTKEYDNIVVKFYSNFIKENIDIRVTSTRTGQLPGMDNLPEKMLNNKFFINEKNYLKQLNLLAYAIYEKTEPNALKENLTEDLLTNINVLYSISQNEGTIKQAIEECNESKLPEKFKLARTIIASELTAFYIVYIYGFDKIYNADQRDHLDKIYEGKMFDFSKLDLSILESKAEYTVKDYLCFKEQLEANKREKNETMDRFFNIDSKRENLENKIDEMKKQNKEIPENMIKALQQQKERLLEINKKYEMLKRKTAYEIGFMDFNFMEYKKNRSMIEHIRNSIAHGNVKVKYMDDSNSNSNSNSHVYFSFKDYENGKQTFSAKLTPEEFNTLITGKNFYAVATFLDENTKKYGGKLQYDTIIPKQKFLKRGKV